MLGPYVIEGLFYDFSHVFIVLLLTYKPSFKSLVTNFVNCNPKIMPPE